MDPEFWHQRWSRDEIGFHQHEYNAHMQAFFRRLRLPPGGHVLVPLCGKSLDMIWLLQQGYRVTGIEISPRAVEDFFWENRLEHQVEEIAGGSRYRAHHLDIYCADFFEVDLSELPAIDGIYDRAALIALPEPMRQGYVRRLSALASPGVRSLLVTLEYPPQELSGPPFTVTRAEIDELFAGRFSVEHVHVEDCLAREPRFREKGLSRMHEHVFLLQRQATTEENAPCPAG